VLPDVYVQLGRGFVLNARAAVRLGTTHGWVAAIDDPPSHRLLLHKAMRVGRVPRSWNALTQFSMGWFAHDAIGISNEIDVSLGDGRISLGSTFAAFGPELGKIDSGVALGNVRVRYPALDLTASLEAGVFLRGDAGAAGELSRFFGDTEVGFYVRSTTFGSVAGMRLSVPLTPARDMRPTRVRPRLPDVYTHTQQITILEYPSVQKRFVGRLLETDHELKRVYRSRDRLQASNLREHVEVLREAALGRLVR